MGDACVVGSGACAPTEVGLRGLLSSALASPHASAKLNALAQFGASAIPEGLLAVRLELACASAKFGLVCINAMLRAALLGWARLNALIGRENSFAMALT